MRTSALHRFVDHGGIFHQVDGEYVVMPDFVEAFHRWLVETGRDIPDAWSADRIARELGYNHPVGRGTGNRVVVGNLSDRFTRPRRYVRTSDGLVRLEQEQAA